MDEAVAIGDRILASRAQTRDGTPTWLGPTGYGSDLSPLQLTKLGPNLYDGIPGIALFLAALGAVTGRADYADMGLQALAPFRRKLLEFVREPDRAAKLDLPIGSLIGIGSFIYSFLKIGEILDKPSLVRDAHEVTVLLTPERIARDQRVRVQTGSAGAILALLSLHKALPEANQAGRSPLDIARECGLHLRRERLSYEGRPKAWPLSPGKPPLLGFCYGAAGTSYALLRLFEISPEPEWRQTAREGWDYVDSFYRPEERRWTDVRLLLQSRFEGPRQGSWRDWWLSGATDNSDLLKKKATQESPENSSETILPNKWCHGAPGIALARLGTLASLDTPEIRDEIEGAMEETRTFARPETFAEHAMDDLCCGHMGRAEALLYASGRLGDESLLEAARALASQVAGRARTNGSYKVTAARGTEHFSPSFFQGHAGIGYTLLRLARPGALPCVLLLE